MAKAMSILDLDDLDSIGASNFTVEDVDQHLRFIAQLIKHSKDEDLEQCKVRMDYWLDKRLEVMHYG